jgi:simple sugar transport system substrate-binding protein
MGFRSTCSTYLPSSWLLQLVLLQVLSWGINNHDNGRLSVGLVSAAANEDGRVVLNCNPCIYRPGYQLRGIFHGEYKNPFWQQVAASAMQSAKDLNIPLTITLYDEYQPERMVQDLTAILTDLTERPETKPDALLVTIPTGEVREAVRLIVQAGIPVFGLNSGYKDGRDAGVLAWVAQDEYIAGKTAAMELIRQWGNATNTTTENTTTASTTSNNTNSNSTTTVKVEQEERGVLSNAVFVNHERGNIGLEDRRQGFADTLLAETGIVVEEVFISVDDNGTVVGLENCPQWDLVLFAGSRAAELVLADSDGILQFDPICGSSNLLGTFDESQGLYEGVQQGNLAFGISSQNFLQGVLPVLFATVYITTGKLPATPSNGFYGVYLSGPRIVNQQNVPSKEKQICNDDAYPTCPNTLIPAALILDPIISNDRPTVNESLSISACPCTDRSKLQLVGVLHGVTIDAFWDPVFAAAELAARDMGVDLDLERLEPRVSNDLVYNAMATKIKAVCQRGVDGLFVSIPSDLVVQAIQECLNKGINVISINAGAELAKQLGLVHHIGQLEFNAGLAAGRQLLKAGVTKVWCLNHEPGTNVLNDRCNGVAVAIAEESIGNRNIEYKGQVVVSREDAAEYKANVEAAVNTDGDWADYGLILTGQIQAEFALLVKSAHPKVLLGSFDESNALFEAMKSNQIVFGIDQQPFLQGYMAVSLLTHLSYSGQRLANDVIESGPSLVFAPPSQEQQICDGNFYDVCIGEPGPPIALDSGGNTLRLLSSPTRLSSPSIWSLILPFFPFLSWAAFASFL